MSDALTQLYQQTILDHSRSPRNFYKLAGATASGEGHNPACGDRFTVFLKLDGPIIQDISFQGSGCAIAKAAASVLTEILKGKSSEEARALFQKYQDLLRTGASGLEVEALKAFSGLRQFPMRIKCALLPWQAAMAALDQATAAK